MASPYVDRGCGLVRGGALAARGLAGFPETKVFGTTEASDIFAGRKVPKVVPIGRRSGTARTGLQGQAIPLVIAFG